jgi:hypothetical protein
MDEPDRLSWFRNHDSHMSDGTPFPVPATEKDQVALSAFLGGDRKSHESLCRRAMGQQYAILGKNFAGKSRAIETMGTGAAFAIAISEVAISKAKKAVGPGNSDGNRFRSRKNRVRILRIKATDRENK